MNEPSSVISELPEAPSLSDNAAVSATVTGSIVGPRLNRAAFSTLSRLIWEGPAEEKCARSSAGKGVRCFGKVGDDLSLDIEVFVIIVAQLGQGSSWDPGTGLRI